LQVTKVAAPEETSADAKARLKKIIRKTILGAYMSFSLDRLIAMMRVTEKQEENLKKFDNSVPRILFSDKPAVLVYIDGEPSWKDVGNNIQRVINSQYLILKDRANSRVYMRCAGRWFTAENLNAEWNVAGYVPSEIEAVLKKVEKSAENVDDDTIPRIFISTTPAELVQCDGEPEIASVPGTQLSYLSNSDNDLFRDENTSRLYLLISGRWFRSKTTDGPWQYVAPDKLPADFKAIPQDSPKADVLASVSGTTESQDAVLESYIPQTATLKRGKSDLQVEYDGKPDFKPVEGTDMRYAVNTESQIVELKGKYYLCEDGAWYVSDSVNGPWEVCTNVPSEIYTIPPDNPLYNTTYVNVYDYDDDHVRVGYFPGYFNSFVCGGIIVYGTGCHYRWWVRAHCYPRHVTYGHRCRYHRWHCRWYRYDRYRDRHGRYVAWNTPARRPREGYRLPPRANGEYRRKRVQTAVSAAGAAGAYNIYKRNKNTVRTSEKARHIRNRAAGTATKGKLKTRPASRPNNVYVGKDGKIYRKGINGWQQRDNKKWQSIKSPAGRPAATRPVNARPSPRPVTRPSVTRPSTRPVTRPSKLPDGISIIPPGQTRPVAKPSVRPVNNRPATRPIATPKPAVRPSPRPVQRPATRPSPVTRDLNRQYQSRQHGNYRTSSAQRHSPSRSVNRSAVRSRAASRGGGRRR
jgi:hypothetical protein